MNRAIITIFLSALVILLISSHDTFASRQRNTSLLPPRRIEHTGGTFRVDSLSGHDVSITFWSSNDAASRLENIRQSILAQKDSTRVHIGVNLDDSPEIYRDFLLRDNLSDDPNQYLATPSSAASLASTYGYATLHY